MVAHQAGYSNGRGIVQIVERTHGVREVSGAVPLPPTVEQIKVFYKRNWCKSYQNLS